MSKVKISKESFEESFLNIESVMEELSQCLLEGDLENFQEVFSEFLKIQNKNDLAKRTGLDRDTIYRAIKKDNLSMDSTFKIINAIRKVS